MTWGRAKFDGDLAGISHSRTGAEHDWYVPYLCYTVDSRSSVGREPLAPLVNSDRFKIIRASKIVREGRPIVEADIEYLPEKADIMYDMKGRLALDPSRHLAILGYSVKRELAGLPVKDRVMIDMTGEVRYSEDEGLAMVPVSARVVELTRTNVGRQIEQRHEFTAGKVSRSVSASQFSPSYYGLAEFGRPLARSGPGAAYWASGVAVLASIVAIVARWLARRPSRMPRP